MNFFNFAQDPTSELESTNLEKELKNADSTATGKKNSVPEASAAGPTAKTSTTSYADALNRVKATVASNAPALKEEIAPKDSKLEGKKSTNVVKSAYQPTDESQKDLSKAVYVGKIPKTYMESDVIALFGRFGEISELDVVRDTRKKNPKKNRGFAFITYKTAEAATKAKNALDGHVLDGNAIVVTQARSEKFGDKPIDGSQHFRLRAMKPRLPKPQKKRRDGLRRARLKAFLDDIDNFPLPKQHIYTDEGPMHVRRGLSISMSPRSHSRSFRSLSPTAYKKARADFAHRQNTSSGYKSAKEEFARRYHTSKYGGSNSYGSNSYGSNSYAFESARQEFARQGYEAALNEFSSRYGSPRSFAMTKYGYEAARADYFDGSPMRFSTSGGFDSFSPRRNSGYRRMDDYMFRDVLAEANAKK